MRKKLLIFPFNGNGLEALDCIDENYDFIGFIDDTLEKQGKHKQGYEVFSRQKLHIYKEAFVLAVPGSPTSYLKRKEYITGLHIAPERFATVIHPKASVSSFANLGYNILLMSGVVITNNALIGNHICVLPNSVIHHETKVGNYTLIGSQVVIAGYTTVGDNCYIGSGSKIINNINIGENSLVGMGSTVIKNVAPNTKVVGNPARSL